MSLPRVLMITGRADSGGGPEHVFQLSRQLLGECDVFIAAPREAPYWDRYIALVGESRVHEIPHRRFSWSALRGLIAWTRKQRIEILHSHGRAGGLYGRLARILLNRPSIHTPNCPLSFRSWRGPIYWTSDLLLSWTTSQLIAVSATEAAAMRKQLIRGRIITTIFNGVPLPDVRVDPLVMSKRPLRVIHVTRFVPQKNSEMVLAIAEKLRSMGILNEFHFDIVGDGPGRSALENESRARGLEHRLTFHGSHPSVRQFFLNGFCILSTSRWEGLPIAVLEALALGLPAVASDTPGNSDVVSTSVGRLFPLNDAQAAAVHLSDLRGSLETWEKLSASAVRLVRGQFSVQRMAADTLTVYRQPLSRTRP